MDKLRRRVIILPNGLPRRGREGSGNNQLFGCAGKNTLSSGGGFDVLSDVGGTEVMGVAIPESDDLYTGFPIETVSYVSDEGGGSDLLNLGAFNSEDVQAQRLDFDDDGTQNSLLLSFGGDPYGLVVLVNHFGLNAPGTDPDGRIERIKFKNGTVDLESASPAEAPAGRRAAIERRLPDDPSGENLLP